MFYSENDFRISNLFRLYCQKITSDKKMVGTRHTKEFGMKL